MWAIVELMGHRTRAGLCSDAQLGGATLLRIEHPTVVGADGEPLVEYYAPAALYAIRPCSEDEARTAARWWATNSHAGELAAPLAELVDDDDDQYEEPFA